MKHPYLLGAITAVILCTFRLSHGDEPVRITELMASNTGPLTDEDGEFSDWIEIHNGSTNVVNLEGWYLTDRASDLRQWRFPGTNLPPNGYLVVFASGKDRRVAGAPFHTSFRLNASGEYLALVHPDGTNVASAFAPAFPPQVAGASFGVPLQQTATNLISVGVTARFRVPPDDALGTAWTSLGFDDAAWLSAPTGLGFETDGQVPFVPTVLADSAADFSGTQGQNNWFYGYWDRTLDGDGQYAPSEFVPFPNTPGPFGSNNFWTGSSWDWFNGNPPFTQLTAQGGRPTGQAGSPTRAAHWAVRRYVSATEGAVTITGQITHPRNWVYVTATGTASSSVLYLYLTAQGDGYVDDLRLVAGATPEVGANLLANGDFESGSWLPWTVSANLAGSVLTTEEQHSGNQSLHLVASAAGSTQGSSIWQTVTPALTSGQSYTLSYWYLPGTNTAPLVARFSGSWINSTATSCGERVVARLLVDGAPVLEQTPNLSGQPYALTVTLHQGSLVDFVLDPGDASTDECDLTTFTGRVAATDPSITTVADTVMDWSFDGTQGYKNWSYGYFDAGTNIPPLTYSAAGFVPFPAQPGPYGSNNFWNGESWKWWGGEPPADEIGPYVMNPNGYNNPPIHWVIRRWISEVSGPLTVNWTLNKLANTGAGLTVRLFRNGLEQDSALVPATNAMITTRQFSLADVQEGDLIDLAVDPAGVGGAYGDGGDRSLFTAEIRGRPSLAGQFASDLQGVMRGVNASVYVRIPFMVADPSQFQFLKLRMKYDDGFVAYLNGQLVASARAPALPAWNSAAAAARPDSDARDFEEFNLAGAPALLQSGLNVLAIHGLNASADDGDFLLLPELVATGLALDPSSPRYFALPTPGGPNGYGTTNLGPLILSAAHSPKVPLHSEDLLVRATVRPSFQALGQVRLIYRAMFGPEDTAPMFDDGQHGDGAAGDGVFGGAIPAGASAPGQMVRYCIYAQDVLGNASRFPAYEDPLNSPRYQGTVVIDPSLTNALPVLHLFVQDPAGATNYTGTRGSLFWGEEFYDNIGVGLHGQTTARVFAKRSMNFGLNPGHLFHWSGQDKPVNGFMLLTTAPDKAFLRHALAYETFAAAGVPTHAAHLLRLQQNGVFHSVQTWVNQGDDRYLERLGLDGEGALYKVYLPLTNAYGGVAEKKTRRNENNDDLQGLIDALNQPAAARRLFVYDNVDLPEVINFLAAIQLVQNEDCCWFKNYYLYRDSNRTREWQMQPWDLDLTFGRCFISWQVDGNGKITGGGYYDVALHAQNLYYTQQRSSFDYIGVSMPLADAIFGVPELFEMFLRRWTTVQQDFLQPPGTHPLALHFEQRVDELAAQLAADSELDRAKWGPLETPLFLPGQTLPEAVGLMKTSYFSPRRSWIFNSLRYSSGGPYLGPQPTNALIQFGAIECNPASGNQAQEFLQLTNAATNAVDISGWRLSGAAQFTFRPGTVIPSRGALYVSPDVTAFRARTVGPRGGQGLFVQGPYQGQLSARGETLQLWDTAGRLVSATNYPGQPSLAQQYLRITELMYHPATPPPGLAASADEFEFIEVRNIGPVALDLAGVRFANGVEFSFTGSAVTNLGPGESAVVVANLAGFTSRYGTGPRVAGEYGGRFENGGENIRLEDAAGEKILEFNYDRDWYPITDGFGFSLVIADDTAPWDTWGLKTSWRPSGELHGSPGRANLPAPFLAPILVNEVASHNDPAGPDALELFNPTTQDVDLGGWFISDDFGTPKKFRVPPATVIPAGGFRVFTETNFNQPEDALTSFAFSSHGDEAYLFSGDAQTNLTGYFHGFAFGASEVGVSFGRHVISTGQEHFVAQAAETLGAANSVPRVGPVIISEIAYHPPDLAGGADNSDDEFIELQNITGIPVALFDPAVPQNTWRLRGGMDYEFPAGVTLAPGGFLLLVSFDPADVGRLEAFRAQSGFLSGVPIFGPFRGKLNNSADSVHLLKPGTPDLSEVPYLVVDAVDYRDGSPWPDLADGTGATLQRRAAALYGNDPAHWVAARPTPGWVPSGAAALVITQHPADQRVTATSTARLSVGAAGTPPLRYQWFFNGAVLPSATEATLILSNVMPAQSGTYGVVVFNDAGAVASSNAVLTVGLGPYFTLQPQSAQARLGENATLTAAATSVTSPVRYQWQFNGADLPRATNATLTVSNVQPAAAGEYQVVASDEIGPVFSQTATLEVIYLPLIVQSPLSQTVVPGATVVLSVVVTNNATLPIGYRWKRGAYGITNGMFVLNERQNFFVITNARPPYTNYSVIVTNIARAGGYASATAYLTFLDDADGDGLPDSWEIAHGFATNNVADRDADADGDGMTNWQEYVAGTDPTNAASYLKVETVAADRIPTLALAVVSNRTYTVQFTDALWSAGSGQVREPAAPGDSPWSRLRDVAASPTNRVLFFTDPSFTSNRFYRVVTPQQP
jgi:hypothetical protein